MSLKALIIEHDSIIEAEQDMETSEHGHERTKYLEGFYVGDYTTHIFENLRFYKRKSGKFTAIYVNPKTGKGMKNPTHNFLSELNKKLDMMKYTVEPQVVQHWKDHIKAKIIKNQRTTITALRKEKEKLTR